MNTIPIDHVVDLFKKATLRIEGVQDSEKALKSIWSSQNIPLLVSLLGRWVIDTRDIPRGKAKPLEIAIHSLTQTPKRYVPFWAETRGSAALLTEASTWPPRTTTQKVGPFELHNTIEASEAVLHDIRDNLIKAAAILKKAPRLSRVLYGPVFLVGGIEGANHAAWYNVSDDQVYVRPEGKGPKPTARLLHEFGHRYWYQFLGPQKREAWIRRYKSIKRTKKPGMPKEGQPVDIPVKGVQGPFFIQSVTADTITLTGPHVSQPIFVRTSQYLKILKLKATYVKFPSRYASTSVEEFFADCFMFYLLGELKDPHDLFFVGQT